MDKNGLVDKLREIQSMLSQAISECQGEEASEEGGDIGDGYDSEGSSDMGGSKVKMAAAAIRKGLNR